MGCYSKGITVRISNGGGAGQLFFPWELIYIYLSDGNFKCQCNGLFFNIWVIVQAVILSCHLYSAFLLCGVPQRCCQSDLRMILQKWISLVWLPLYSGGRTTALFPGHAYRDLLGCAGFLTALQSHLQCPDSLLWERCLCWVFLLSLCSSPSVKEWIAVPWAARSWSTAVRSPVQTWAGLWHDDVPSQLDLWWLRPHGRKLSPTVWGQGVTELWAQWDGQPALLGLQQGVVVCTE